MARRADMRDEPIRSNEALTVQLALTFLDGCQESQ